MNTYILIDAANLFFRCRHIVRGDDAETKIAMCYHTMLNSINKVWRDFKGTHVIFTFEGRSWRKSVEPTYKANRSANRDALTAKEKEEETMFYEAFDNFKTWLTEKTNVNVLQHKQCEADDFIARWIQNYKQDQHIIISSDSDFYQLLAANVKQFNGITKQTITLDGVLDERGRKVLDKKTKQPLPAPDPEWLLFEKCMRGDSSDNIFSAFPGVREKGSKNKVGLREAFSDRNDKGYNWNNLMLQRWTDHNEVEHRVKDRYEANKLLIDLTRQPDSIKAVLDETIESAKSAEAKKQVGVELLRFCGKWDLQDIAKRVDDHVAYLNARLPVTQ